MKKKFLILVTLLMCFCFVLSGCTLFERDLSKYYNQTVVDIQYADGKSVKINKKEFLIAFNNYGAQYVSNGYSYDFAVEATLTALINQKVLIEDSKDKITFTNLERNTMWKDTYKSLFTNLQEYIDEIKEEWEITIAEETEEEDSTSTKYTPYSPEAEVVYENGHYVIKVVSTTKEDDDVALICTSDKLEDIVDSLYNAVYAKTAQNNDMTDYQKQTARVYQEAIKRYINFLKTTEEGLKLSTDNAEVFKREIERIYNIKYESTVISKMKEYISYQTDLSQITTADVLNYYKSMVLESMVSYQVDDSGYDNDMLKNFSDVNYFTNTDYFYVSHILLQYNNDEQKNKYTELSTLLKDEEISKTVYDQEIQLLANEIIATEKDSDGNVVKDSNKKAGQVLTELQDALAICTTSTQKDQVFKEFLYRYGQDTGTNNAEYMYVMNTEGESGMVAAFEDASRELDTDGTYGAITGLVVSEYGVHIIYYGGRVQNTFEFANADDVKFEESDIKIMTETLLSPFNNKTLFDKVYESIVIAERSSNQIMYLNTLKSDLKIIKYTDAYKELLD